MVFSSLEFMFFYLPITLIVYYAAPQKFRNVWLLLISLVFYGWGEPVYVLLMLFTIAVSYGCGLLQDKFKDNRSISRNFMLLAIIVNLAILAYFKYSNFFIDNLHMIPALSWLPSVNVELPIGISFYTFQTLSYNIDLYRNDGAVQKNVISFGVFAGMFPNLLAGPILRYRDVNEQVMRRKHSVNMFASGVRTFMAGLMKKLLLANTAGQLWTNIRALPGVQMSALDAWLGVLMFSFQIYFDFSAYSDMAIGLGRMLGFSFIENFNYPYISKSITEFWRRWHISLSTWFREYVYIPLGGNRKGKFKMYRNLAIVWLLTGFWHGASWNYVLWGVYFGILLMLEKGFLLKKLEKLPVAVGHIYALVAVFFSWWLFTFENIGAGIKHLTYMFGAGGGGLVDSGAVYTLLHALPLIAIMIIGSTPLPKNLWYKYKDTKFLRIATPVCIVLFMGLCTAYMVDNTYNPFLYFRF